MWKNRRDEEENIEPLIPVILIGLAFFGLIAILFFLAIVGR